MVSTIPDLIALAEDDETWKEVTGSFPPGMRNKLRAKADELSKL